ncbi:MAG: class I SAM-dependent methyltransferase, partial [Micavibrio aeruginosavorus]
MLNRLITDRLLKCLENLEKGTLSLTLPDGKVYNFTGKLPGPNADIQIYDWRVPTNLIFKGDTGLAEDYRDGLWQSDNLENLITLAIDNDHILSPFLYGSAFAQKIGNLSYMLRLNTIKGSRRNISAHYDLGNDFYKLWLDPTMTYSSALFTKPEENLEQAQLNKYDRIINRLGQSSGSVLEVGCGWGGFAERASSKGDFDIKGITLSNEQYHYATAKLKNKAKIVLEDYRAQSGTFDNIVSIEMFEAVGERYWRTYFDKIAGMLRNSGRAVIQTITIDDHLFDRYRGGNDFIRSFIFPGGMLPGP